MVLSKKVKIADLKSNLSRYLKDVKGGQNITVMERDTPIAFLVAYGQGVNGAGIEIRKPVLANQELTGISSPLKNVNIKNLPSSLEILSELRSKQ
jgi:antitoxin (DNA-binding transcriptional repressor) of toxin-antitoxin stability system